ncbi:MAG: trypsin-like peptidase domain-containing protein [Pseudazoarcus pumilus]|nr:trypsin-like peptidase domain-containing protein [Pseudazoarcus pumilus]
MHRLWLIFAQAVTVTVAALFVLSTLKPDWLAPVSSHATVVTVREALYGPDSATADPAAHSLADAASRSMPAVVHVFTRSAVRSQRHPLLDDPLFQRFFGAPPEMPREESSGLGSGVIVSPDGFILTNNHVIESAEQIEVALNDGRKFPAEVVGRDPESDLAVLRIRDAGELPPITFSPNENLRVGDTVLAIGNPFGVGQTVTMGIISGLGRSTLGINTFENYIQTDAAINPGNSGGALVDREGRLIGINTAIYSNSGGSLGIGFAIPASLALDVFRQIVADGQVTRGWIGVEIQEVSRELAVSFGLPEEGGALIAGVLRGGPAERGGLQPGDVLMQVEGKPIRTAREVLDTVSGLRPGQQVRVSLWRERRALELGIEIGRRPTPQQNARR